MTEQESLCFDEFVESLVEICWWDSIIIRIMNHLRIQQWTNIYSRQIFFIFSGFLKDSLDVNTKGSAITWHVQLNLRIQVRRRGYESQKKTNKYPEYVLYPMQNIAGDIAGLSHTC